MTPVHFRDVTAEATPDVHFPQLVRWLEDLGFVTLGRMARVIAPRGHGAAGRRYPRRHHAAFLTATAVPPTVLAAPDATAFVLVDWWWGMPEVRLRTLLTPVRPWRRGAPWDRYPVWRRDVQRGARHVVLHEEQRLSDAPRRSVDVVTGGPTALWQAHRVRVAGYVQRYGGQAVTHQHTDQALALSRRLGAHDLQTERRRGANHAHCGGRVLQPAVLRPRGRHSARLDDGPGPRRLWRAGGAVVARRVTRHVRYGRGNRPRFA